MTGAEAGETEGDIRRARGYARDQSERGDRCGGSLIMIRWGVSKGTEVWRSGWGTLHTLEEERAVPADLLGAVGFRDGRTVRGGVDRLVLGGKYLLGWHYCFSLWVDVVRCKRRWSERRGRERGMGWGVGCENMGGKGKGYL